MNIPLLNWFTHPEGLPELVRDLRTGRAGFVLRVALSIAAAGAVIALVLGIFGLISLRGNRIEDAHGFIGVALGGVLWCGALSWLWNGYRSWHRTLRTAFRLIAMWAVIIPVTVGIDSVTYNGEFLIAAFIVFGLTATLAVIATVAYRSRGGRHTRDRAGDIHVLCPQCGYSMVGLENCQCPECGHRCTIDALIAAQDYDAHRQASRSLGNAPAPAREAESMVNTDRQSIKALPQGHG